MYTTFIFLSTPFCNFFVFSVKLNRRHRRWFNLYYLRMSTAIEFENICKQYRLGLVSTGTLSHDLNRLWIRCKRIENERYIID